MPYVGCYHPLNCHCSGWVEDEEDKPERPMVFRARQDMYPCGKCGKLMKKGQKIVGRAAGDDTGHNHAKCGP